MLLRGHPRLPRPALLAGGLLAALVALCGWGAWVVAQPDLAPFLLPGAHDIHYAPVGPGMQSLLYTYEGDVIPQSDRLYSALARCGWRGIFWPARRKSARGATCGMPANTGSVLARASTTSSKLCQALTSSCPPVSVRRGVGIRTMVLMGLSLFQLAQTGPT